MENEEKINVEDSQISEYSTNIQAISIEIVKKNIVGKPATVRMGEKPVPRRKSMESEPERLRQSKTAADKRLVYRSETKKVDGMTALGKMDYSANIHFLDTVNTKNPFTRDMTRYKALKNSVDANILGDRISVDLPATTAKMPFSSQLVMVDTMKFPRKSQIVIGGKTERKSYTFSVDTPIQKIGVDKKIKSPTFGSLRMPVKKDRFSLNDSFRMIQSGDFSGGIKTAISDLSGKMVAGLKMARLTAKKELIKGAVFLLAPFVLAAFILFSIVGIAGGTIAAPVSFFGRTVYPTDEKDITESTFDATNYCEDLKETIKDIPNQPEWQHIDEFQYVPSLDSILAEIDYDPWELQAYLNAKFENYNAADVSAEIQSVMNEMFVVDLNEIVEIRQRLNDDGDMEDYEYYILQISLNKTELETVTGMRMNDEQKEMYGIYMDEDLRGAHQGITNPFDFDWRPYVSCRFGWRENPTSPQSGMEFHTGLDIALSEGTPISAGVTGYVTKITSEWPYGNRVEITSPDEKIRVLYAHMSSISVTMGQPVITGVTEIGKVGTTGNSTGPHLHIEIYKNDEILDPLFILGYGKKGE